MPVGRRAHLHTRRRRAVSRRRRHLHAARRPHRNRAPTEFAFFFYRVVLCLRFQASSAPVGHRLGFTGFYLVFFVMPTISSSASGFLCVQSDLSWILLGFNEFYWVLPCFTGFYRVLVGFTEFYWVLPNFTGILPSLTVLLGFTEFYWVLPSFTGFYRVLPSVTGFFHPLYGVGERVPYPALFASFSRPGALRWGTGKKKSHTPHAHRHTQRHTVGRVCGR